MNISNKTIIIRDHGHHNVALVPLSRGKGFAKLDEKDFITLQAAGHIGPWYLNGNGQGNSYVKTVASGKLKQVARLLLNPAPGLLVQYRDGDPTNLRRSNLLQKSRKDMVNNYGNKTNA